jgi:hypothetical protein
MTQNKDSAIPPDQKLFELTTGFWVAKGIGAMVRLELADQFGEAPVAATELAAKRGLHAPSVYRLLRMLAAVGLLTEHADQTFTLTPVGALLRKDHPRSMRAMIELLLFEEHSRAWDELAESVRTGKISTDLVEGKDIWAFFRGNHQRGAIFNDAMTSYSGMADDTVAETYNFGRHTVICDLGGGHGGQLAAILRRYPALRGFVVDQDYVVEGAKAKLHPEFGDRAWAVAGNFFEVVPEGADVYIAKSIIHDWDDEKSIKILRNIRKVIPAHGCVQLMELTVAPPNIPDPGKFLDVHMMAMTGGKERTAQEFSELFGAAGFRLGEIRPTRSPMHVVEALPV